MSAVADLAHDRPHLQAKIEASEWVTAAPLKGGRLAAYGL